MSKQRDSRGPSRKIRPGGILEKVKCFSLHPAENRQVIEHFYSSLDTPISLSCALLYKYGEYDQLVSKQIDPADYNSADCFRDDFASISFLRKHETLKTSYNTRAQAISDFLQTETACKSTNDRIRSYLNTGLTNPDCESTLNVMIRKIDRILGDFCIDEVLDLCGWGPGVTIAIKGENTSGPRKFDSERSVTRDLYDLFSDVCKAAYPTWEGWNSPSYEVGNVVITVPKNAKVDRTIAVEPGLNSWIQQGLGKVIRRRLRRAGYNLNSDLKNQRGAYIGSIDGSLATIDFKAASDTISSGLVELLLPPRWFTVLNAARSQYYSLSKDSYNLSHKFSAMGNGFTFELESLIFLAMGLAVCEVNSLDDVAVSIFGDDLIVPSAVVTSLTKICDFAGFTINTSKSFSTGYFRESCGSYYFNGQDVKPVFFKRDLRRVKDIYRMLNAVRRLAHTRGYFLWCDARLRALWSFTLHRLPEVLRLFGPVSGGDSVIHENIHEKVRIAPDGLEGYLYSGLPEVPLTITWDSQGLLLHRLHKPSKEPSFDNEVPLRARTRIIFKKSMFVYSWYELGPWI